MDRTKLIVRRMREEFTTRIGHVDGFWSEKNIFKTWCYSGRRYDDPESEDNLLAERAAEFLHKRPFAFVVACMFDRGKKAWKAWRAPYLLARALGVRNLTPKLVASSSLATLRRAVIDARLGCFLLGNDKAARLLKALARQIIYVYGGHSERIWQKAASFEDLKERVYGLEGIGIGIGNMMILIFLSHGMIPQLPKTKKVMKTVNLKPDTHVRQVFLRTGVARSPSESALMDAAKLHADDFPGSLDGPGFQIGVLYCSPSHPDCDECPLAWKTNGERLCPRRKVA